MAITLNGTTGITTPDITSEAGLTVDGVSFASGAPANTLVTTSSGKVGIGTSSPSATLHTTRSGVEVARFTNSQSNGGDWEFKIGGGGFEDRKFMLTDKYSGADNVRMTIDSSGRFMVGTTGNNVTNGGFLFDVAYAGHGAFFLGHASGVSSGATFIGFRYNNGNIGGINQNGTTGVSYTTSSDYRLKENVVGVTGASARVQQLNPVRFNFIADPDRTVDGFLAHEVQDVVPEAITGTKDATEMVDVHDEDGNVTGQEERPVYQGIDQSKLVPLLTAALQEALTKIETLEARVAALEAA